jgi:hypothetical protein
LILAADVFQTKHRSRGLFFFSHYLHLDELGKRQIDGKTTYKKETRTL